MKFNKKSLVKVTILSAILGLNGMCFGSVVNGAFGNVMNGTEVMLVSPGDVVNPQRQQDEPRKDEEEPRENEEETACCVICYEEDRPDLFEMGCCKRNMCSKCVLDADNRYHRCPLCWAGDEEEETKTLEINRKQGKTSEEIEKIKRSLENRRMIYRGTVEVMKKKAKVQDPANENPDNRKPEKENMENDSLSNKVNKKPIRLSDDFAIRLSTTEMGALGGKGAWVATFQNKYAQNQMSNITNEKAWELFEQGKFLEFEKMYDDAATYRLAQKMTIEDARDAILEKTSSNCSNNACCESERVTTTSDFAPGYGPVTVTLSDGTEVTVD